MLITTNPTIKLPKPHAGQQQIIDEARRFNAIACGRRFGKTTLGIILLILVALAGYPVAWFSPTYKMLSDVWRDMVRILNPIIIRQNAQQHRLELITGGVIDMWSLDSPDVARGRKYKRVVIDEAAMISSLQEAWQSVIRPTLADFEGDAFFLSTPRGFNFFKAMFDWGQDEIRTDWASWQMPTSSNPFMKQAEIDAMQHEMTERRFGQEVLAMFLDDSGGVFRHVRDSAVLKPLQGPESNARYVIGCDWGKTDDYTVLLILDIINKKVVYMDRSNKVDYVIQRGRLAALCEKWKPAAVIAESNSIGTPIIEALSRERIPVRPFVTTNATKANIIDALSLAFERGDIQIIDDSVLISELQAYEATKLPSGLTRYSAPEMMHDDTVMALAMAWSCIGKTSSAVGAFR